MVCRGCIDRSIQFFTYLYSAHLDHAFVSPVLGVHTGLRAIALCGYSAR